MSRQSRYHNPKAFIPEPGSAFRFRGIMPRFIETAEGVIEHSFKEWDRMDLLSLNYYSDTDLWWKILDANPEYLCAIDLEDFSPDGSKSYAEKVILIPAAGNK